VIVCHKSSRAALYKSLRSRMGTAAYDGKPGTYAAKFVQPFPRNLSVHISHFKHPESVSITPAVSFKPTHFSDYVRVELCNM